MFIFPDNFPHILAAPSTETIGLMSPPIDQQCHPGSWQLELGDLDDNFQRLGIWNHVF